MGMQWKEEDHGKVLEVQASGKLGHEDYERFAAEFDRLVKEHGMVSVLFDMVDFHGWTPRALWDDLKLDLRHSGEMKRVAMVGDKQWEKRASMLFRPVTPAQVRYYDRSKIDEARDWVRS
jgi:universal stress protein A